MMLCAMLRDSANFELYDLILTDRHKKMNNNDFSKYDRLR